MRIFLRPRLSRLGCHYRTGSRTRNRPKRALQRSQRSQEERIPFTLTYHPQNQTVKKLHLIIIIQVLIERYLQK